MGLGSLRITDSPKMLVAIWSRWSKMLVAIWSRSKYLVGNIGRNFGRGGRKYWSTTLVEVEIFGGKCWSTILVEVVENIGRRFWSRWSKMLVGNIGRLFWSRPKYLVDDFVGEGNIGKEWIDKLPSKGGL